MVELAIIESNIAKIAQIISRTSGHSKRSKDSSDPKTYHWNYTGGTTHLSIPNILFETHFVDHDS